MFYAHFVLSKKGPLARIWLAAHWDKKLTRAHVFETDISSSVEAILEPKVKLALRTSGHLLLGVVRIYSRQAKYLLADCNEAFVKIKMAFRPGAEVTEETHRDSCNLAAITLADNMHDFESTLAELTEMDPYSISVNQSRPEDITMREEFGEPNLGRPDDDFGDSTFEEGAEREYGAEHVAGDVMEMDEHHEAELTLTSELVRSQPSQVYTEMPPSVSMASNDEFDDMMDVDYDSGENLDRNMEEAVLFQDTSGEKLPDSFSRVDSEMADTTMDTVVEQNSQIVPLPRVSEEEEVVNVNQVILNEPVATEEEPLRPPIIEMVTATKRLPQFVLPPVTQSSRADHRRTANKRKRRLLIDEHKSIPSDVMKMQMQDTSEITTRLDLAPPTRKLMLWKETGSVDSLFTTPGRAIPSRVLQRLFYRNLKTVPVPNDSPDGLPVFQTCKVIVEQRPVTPVPIVEDQEQSHDLYNIAEISQEHEQAMISHPGACSSYSANYECFSGQPTPRRPDEEEEEEICEQQPPVTIAVTDISEQSVYSQPPIEEPRISLDDGHLTFSTNDGFDTTFNDRSIVSEVLEDVTILEEMDRCHGDSLNNLQNTMLALDNELDIIDRQFPIEMTQEGLEKRSEIMLNVLQDAMKRDNLVVFQHLTVSNNKKQAASKFYTLLLLGKQKAITLHQETPFSNIIITPYQCPS